MLKFATLPVKYAPKRKFIEFAKPKWHNKLGEFSDPDVLSWINNLYQDKVFKTPKDFNFTMRVSMDHGVRPISTAISLKFFPAALRSMMRASSAPAHGFPAFGGVFFTTFLNAP